MLSSWQYICPKCGKTFSNTISDPLHVQYCEGKKKQNINFDDKPYEFPITDGALKDVKRVSDDQDLVGIKKYGKPLDHKMDYNWREMKLQEFADYMKYDYCEYLDKQEAIRILQSAVTLEHAENIRNYIKFALEILTKTNTGK